ncbi:HAD-IC family P-type ATPase [Chelativorans sp. ZYF759]|uniref:HAD-IC family P-type ATPase n=1 Tax=Chelativorans sp. ZYF759 TaxID=2692213 RepID=UPI001AED6B52|nr:HAD-IC family P-type ATPase [Chelativorans sp. ZYF759]
MNDVKESAGRPSWAEPAESVLALTGSDRKGLSQAEARRRLEAEGANRLPEPPRRTALQRLVSQFNNLLILVLIGAAAITALLGHFIDTFVILAVVAANTLIGFFQEGKAEEALEALRGMLAPRASVLRDGRRVEIAADELVRGDIVQLEAGDKVPADLRLVSASSLSIEEAILTGESVPTRKQVDPVEKEAVLGDRRSMAYSGTMVTRGTAAGVVVGTGPHSEIGRISGLLANVEQLTTPLIQQMGVFARYLTGVILAISALILLWGTLLRDQDFAETFMVVVGLTVAAIPEGLPAVLTVTLAIGVQTMARRNAIVRRLPTIETLGAVSVICSDKTGTLTRNEMMVTTLLTAEGRFDVSGTGYTPAGEISREGETVDPDATPALADLARIAALCNTAALHEDSHGWRVEGDPMEGALLALAAKLGVGHENREEPADSIPFDAEYRYMATLHGAAGDMTVALVKGAPERILDMCGSELSGEGPRPLDRRYWTENAESIANDGQRVLALAMKEHAGSGIDHDDIAEGLVLVGFVGLIDPPRPEAITAVADCQAAGIVVKMITGDHAGTAAAIGRQIGLKRTGKVLTGADIEAMDEASLAKIVLDTDIFARTSPEHKLRLVTALQSHGHVVAMTGDGVNDAPSLKRADAGIAMGRKGSEATREASDLVLADDNFASIAEAVRQGRTVYANLKKVVTFLLPVNGGESLSLMIAIVFGLVLPITPAQILWVNMVSSVALAMSLAFEAPERDIMRQPPRDRTAPILSRFLVWRVALVSVLFSIGVFGQFALARSFGDDIETARTMALNTLVAMEVFYLFSVRYLRAASITWEGVRGTQPVLIAVAIVVVLQAVFTYVPFMQLLFETRPLSLVQLAQCALPGLVLLLILEMEKMIVSRFNLAVDHTKIAEPNT